jgi:large subunit ribosomal protein L3
MTHANARAVKGVLGEKLGMTQVWDADSRLVPVTVVQAGPNVVTQVRDAATDGYAAVQLAFGAIDPRKVNKPMGGHFEKAGVTPRRYLVELRTADAGDYALGQEITAEAFEAGRQRSTSRARSKGKGFAGVMKRHGFSGVGASHGAHRNHRKPGSIGAAPPPVACSRACAWPAAWAACARPRRTSRSTPSTSSAAAARSRAPSPAPRRHRPRPHRGEGSLSHDRPSTSLTRTAGGRHHRVAGRDLRRPDQRAADPPGRRGAARGRPPGHARHQDPRRGPRWWPQALQAEGHRPRPSGFDACTAVRRRWHGPRPTAARLRQRTPKKMKAAALRGALSDRARHGRIHVVESSGRPGPPRRPRMRWRCWPVSPSASNLLVVLDRATGVSAEVGAQPRQRARPGRRPAQHLRRVVR